MSHIGHMFLATQSLKQLKIHLIADRWRSNLDHHSTFQISLPGKLTEWDLLRIQICSKRKVFLDSPTCFTNNLLKIASQFGLLKLAQRIPLFWGHQTYYVSIVSWLQSSQFTGSVHGEISFCTKISHNQSHLSIYLHFARSTQLWCRIEDFHCSQSHCSRPKQIHFVLLWQIRQQAIPMLRHPLHQRLLLPHY